MDLGWNAPQGSITKLMPIWWAGLHELKISSGINFYDFNGYNASFYKAALAHFLVLLSYCQSSLCYFFCWKWWWEMCLSFELLRFNHHCEDTWGCLSKITSSNCKWSRNFIKMKTVLLLLYSGSSCGYFTQAGNKALGMKWQIAPLFMPSFSLYNSKLSFLLRIIVITFLLEWVPQAFSYNRLVCIISRWGKIHFWKSTIIILMSKNVHLRIANERMLIQTHPLPFSITPFRCDLYLTWDAPEQSRTIYHPLLS